MAYIGKTPVIGNFVKLDSITAVNGQAAYTMQNGGSNFTDYESVNQFLVSLNGTIQAPTDSFTVSGSTLTFASNLSTGDVIDFIMVFGNSLSAGTPTDATVSTAKIVDDAVTAAKINDDIISGATELATEPADTDEFLVSDAGTLKRIDYSLIKGGGITEADIFRLTTNLTSSADPISSNLERPDNASYAKIGTGMSVSSGLYSFPTTGLYWVQVRSKGETNGSQSDLYISGTTNNGSSFDNLAVGSGYGASNDATYIGGDAFFNVTDVSTHKIKFKWDAATNSILFGSTNRNDTVFIFIRIGDSQ